MPAPYFVDEVRLGLLDGDYDTSWPQRTSSVSTSTWCQEKETHGGSLPSSPRSSTTGSDTTFASNLLPRHHRQASPSTFSSAPFRRRRVLLCLITLAVGGLGLYALLRTTSIRLIESTGPLDASVPSDITSEISLHNSDSSQDAAASQLDSPSVLPFELHHDESIDLTVQAPSKIARNRRLLYEIPAQAPLFESDACLELWIASGTVCDHLRGVYNDSPELSSVDILYSWVNGSDWRHSSAKWMHAFKPNGRWQEYYEKDLYTTSASRAAGNSQFQPPASIAGSNWHKRDTAIESRFRDHEELRYAMRSATKHLQGLKTIHIVAPDYSAPYYVQPNTESQKFLRRSSPFRLDSEGLAKAFRGLPSQLRRMQDLTTDRFTTQEGQVREGQVPQWLSTSTSSRVLVGQKAESSLAASVKSSKESPQSAKVPEIRLHHDWNTFKDNWLITGPLTSDEVQHQQDYRRLALPTFNSMAVESMLGDEPGLSENFIYANDDFFFLDDTSVSDIVSPLYGPVFRLDPNLSVDGRKSPKPAVGEWASLWHTNWLLDQRFGIRKRPYTIHVQKSFSKSLLMETRMTWAAEHAKLGLTRFRTGGDNIVTHFLAYYNTIERHREALLWSFFLLRLDLDGDGKICSDEWRAALSQMGLSQKQLETVMAPSADEHAVTDLRVFVKLPKRRTLAKQDVNGALTKMGWPVPLKTRYVFSSQDGYPLSELSEEVVITPKTLKTGRRPTRASSASSAKRSESLIADWPDFVDESSHHVWADNRFQRVACTLDLGKCLTKRIPAASGNASWEGVFKHFAYADPSCGDCLIHHLMGQSGDKGFEAFLPQAGRVARPYGDMLRKDGMGLGRVPHLPLATSWNGTGPAKVGELEASCFSAPCVFTNSGYDFGFSLRNFAAKLIQRYSYVIGNSPVEFKQLETLPGALITFDSLDQSLKQPSALEALKQHSLGDASALSDASSEPSSSAWLDSQAHINAKRPVFVCINDDIRERWIKSVGERLTQWLARTWPEKQPWEI